MLQEESKLHVLSSLQHLQWHAQLPLYKGVLGMCLS